MRLKLQSSLAKAVLTSLQKISVAALFVRCDDQSPRLVSDVLTENLPSEYQVKAVTDSTKLPSIIRTENSKSQIFAVASKVMDAPTFGQRLVENYEDCPPLLLASKSSLKVSNIAEAITPLSLRRSWLYKLPEAASETLRFSVVEPKPTRQVVRESPLQKRKRDKLMSYFSWPIRRMSLEKLRTMRPFEFLAYLGDPDAAPGGGSSVQMLSQRLLDLGLTPDSKVLDVGCFSGLSSMVLGRSFHQVLGIDNDPEFVSLAKLLANRQGSSASFAQLDATDLALDDASIDAYVLTATLGFSPEPEELIEEGRRVLRSHGYMAEFLYDYREVPTNLVRTLQNSISAHLRVTSLGDQLCTFEQRGLELISAERLPLLKAHPNDIEDLVSSIVEREKQRNFQIYTDHDWATFEKLVRTRACPIDMGEFQPAVYLCIFQKQ